MYNNVQDCSYLALQLQYICKINIAKLHKNCIKIVLFLHFSCKLQKNVLSLHCFYKERTTKKRNSQIILTIYHKNPLNYDNYQNKRPTPRS